MIREVSFQVSSPTIFCLSFFWCVLSSGFLSVCLSLSLRLPVTLAFALCLSLILSFSFSRMRFAVEKWFIEKIDELINLCFVLGKQSNKEPLINVKMVCLKLGLKLKSINKGNKQNLNVLMVTINHTNAETKYSYNWNNGKSYDSVNKMTLCTGQFNKKTGIITQIYSEYIQNFVEFINIFQVALKTLFIMNSSPDIIRDYLHHVNCNFN